MHRRALIFTACLFVAGSAAAAGVPAHAAGSLDTPRVLAPAWLPLLQAPDGEAEGTAPAQPENAASDRADEGIPVVQEIVAGLLTGSLAAVLMLKLLYGRRRKDDSH